MWEYPIAVYPKWGVVITGPIKRAVIAGSYAPLYAARVVACSRNQARSGNSDGLVREQVSPLAVVPHNPFIPKEYKSLILTQKAGGERAVCRGACAASLQSAAAGELDSNAFLLLGALEGKKFS